LIDRWIIEEKGILYQLLLMRPLSLCTGEQPLVPTSSNFIFSCTNLTTRNTIELATLASFLTITHCTVSKVFLFSRHLSWGKRKHRWVRSRKREKLHYLRFYPI